MAQKTAQSSEQPPAQPAYVLRGHSAQIHAVHFWRQNSRLLTGDADGFVVVWSTTSKRAVAVWKAHSNTILGLGSWEDDKIITHGRDNKLSVWQLKQDDEPNLDTILPIDDATASLKPPWILHSLDVNAMNFCPFAMIHADPHGHNDLPTDGIFVATPGVQDGHANVTSLPEEERIASIPAPQGENTGMTMAIAMCFQDGESAIHVKELLVVAGYESGHACVWRQKGVQRSWKLVYMQKPHAQPVLSLSIAKSHGSFFSSSADAIVARHPLVKGGAQGKTVQTKHAGQQGVVVRNDEKVFATAGWDSKVRVYSVKTMKELAVLKWHKEGCYALAFAHVRSSGSDQETSSTSKGVVSGENAKSDMTVAEQREHTAKTTHWLAAGSKDGKVSLWDMY